MKHGDLIFTRGGSNIIGPLIRNSQGDFDFEHVCSVWRLDGKLMILTTGAEFNLFKGGFLYGMVPAGEYLAKRSYAVGRRIDLTDKQQDERLAVLQSLIRMPYATGKVLKLVWKGRTSGRVVNQLHDVPDLNPKSVFCAEAEALGLMKVGAVVNSKYPRKLEPCVHTPETLFDAPETIIVDVVTR